jgi:fused signal recognition particle receptor
VLLAAGDTFRAAATEQLEIWANRCGATWCGKEGADPLVIFEASSGPTKLTSSSPTRGPLHTKTDLMEELQKVPGRRQGRAGRPMKPG